MVGQPLAPVIVVGGHKGGIGRTVTAVNLAAMLALSGRRTLLLDLDPKGDATAALGLPREEGRRVPEDLSDPEQLLAACRPAPCPPGLDVWPGGQALEGLQAQLWKDEDPPVDLLQRGLELARRRYRAILIDSLPALDPLGCNGVSVADYLVLPLSGQAFSAQAHVESLQAAERLCSRRLRIVGVCIGVRPEEVLGGKRPLMPPSSRGSMVLESAIAYDAHTLLQAADRGLPVFEHAPGSRVARSFLELGREVIAKLVDAPAPVG